MDLSFPVQQIWQCLLSPFSSRVQPEKQETYLVLNRSKDTIVGSKVKLAASAWTRAQGLLRLSRQNFGSGCGLWLTPAQMIHTFFMSFPIDAVYLDSKGKVIHACPRLNPFQIAPLKWQAHSVLELPAGTLDETKTRLGDQLEIRIPDLQTKIDLLCKKAERIPPE